MVFCNKEAILDYNNNPLVTILILVDGFLQYGHTKSHPNGRKSHNPYFSRWFSAIKEIKRQQKNTE